MHSRTRSLCLLAVLALLFPLELPAADQTSVLSGDAATLASSSSVRPPRRARRARKQREARAAAVRQENVPPEGFTALFNGKDLTNWKGLIELPQRMKLAPEALPARQEAADEKMRAHWRVESGALKYDGKGDSLQTARDYGNFELLVDWRIDRGGDTGIYLRGNPQVQIWDNPVGSGGLFNNQMNPSKPAVVADRPVGEWNSFKIKMVGDRVTVDLNGKRVVDNVPMENYWERGKPLPSSGPIELQHHEHPIEFKNIFIRELP